MNENILSKRLKRIAEEVPAASRLADIGTDHGYLPMYLMKQGKINWALASDVNAGPLESAKKNIKSENLEDYIETRLGHGLSVIDEADHIDTIVIAGMGGSLICEILNSGKEQLENVEQLILQPNIHASVIRRWMIDHKWELVQEHILEEDERIYEILVAKPGEGDRPYQNVSARTEASILFGPFLIQKRSPAFMKKWKREKEIWQRILQELEKASTDQDTEKKRAELLTNIQLFEEVCNDESR
ncbi:tRNA (adenine(22)-N(1))-methyltransferase [Alteribacillus iranensis]|uniref:tRNA (Adenine22-N1)-methyltransferase n=1 Tax=Alteribacillus iranensis TaxID=930128 RepID=A0A1I1ZFF9_9BACI|nr:tRNA (adenine(22)-N(1))-methyltransferase TrmK [Alteribacillus iranensis]SFE29283.1 tRNA (adenine22-N1)-methyltransferase [Alteribacillus iranensis]